MTYDWGPPDNLPVGDPRLDNNPFFNDYLQGAIEKKMAAKGLRARRVAGRPDLLIHYHASVNQKLDVYGVDHRYGYCYGNCEPQVADYEAGHARHRHRRHEDQQGRLARMGAGRMNGIIDNQDRLEKQVDEERHEDDGCGSRAAAPLCVNPSGLDRQSEQGPDGGGQAHSERAPERHAHRRVTGGAPPTPADSAPSTNNDTSEAPAIANDALEAAATAVARGKAAPTANLPADAKAACTGLALRASLNPSSSRACAPSASLAISCFATSAAS